MVHPLTWATSTGQIPNSLLYLVVEMKSGELAMVQRYDETEEIDPDPTWGHRWTENKTNLGCFHGRDRRRGFVSRTQRSIVILMP